MAEDLNPTPSSSIGVNPIYKYVKQITDANIDALDNTNEFNDAFKFYTKQLRINDKIYVKNIVKTEQPHKNMFFFVKVGGNDNSFFLPEYFLNTNFEKVDNIDNTTQSRRISLGGKRKRKTRQIKSKRRMTMRKKRRNKK